MNCSAMQKSWQLEKEEKRKMNQNIVKVEELARYICEMPLIFRRICIIFLTSMDSAEERISSFRGSFESLDSAFQCTH